MAKRIIFAEHTVSGSYIHEAIYRINVGQNLSEEFAFSSFREALSLKDPSLRGVFMGILLNGVMAKKPTIEETVGFIRAALSFDKIDPTTTKSLYSINGRKVIGLAGSGKKGIKTINISSCAALVASSLGAYIAKACAGSTSSTTGSRDFIEGVGVDINIDNQKMVDILKKTGIGFFKIEKEIPKFDSVYGGKFYAPHVLSFCLPALVLPFKPGEILYGLAHPNIDLSLQVFSRFKRNNVMVVSSTDDGVHFLDEVGVFGTTTIIGTRDGVIGKQITTDPASTLHFPRYNRNDISPALEREANIRIAIHSLMGKARPALVDLVCVNSGTLLYLGGLADNLEDGYKKSKQAIQKGLPILKLKQLIKSTGGNNSLLGNYLR